MEKQATRGYKTVADGWAGAQTPSYISFPPPRPPSPHTASQMRDFTLSNSSMTYGLDQCTDGRTDGTMDGQIKLLIE